MHTRLPTFTFTNNPLYAQQTVEATAPTALTFYQGSTLTFDVFLSDEAGPLDHSNYTLLFVLKKLPQASNILYRANITERPIDNVPGHYRITVPAVVSQRLLPGVYYYAIQATNKTTGMILPPMTGTITVELSVASPNPQWEWTDGEPTAIGQGGTADELLTPGEVTLPTTPDIGRSF